ncbi:hypothetical protein HK097_010452 [Rhizophlyctis rosea]|uniref:Uncharacterized protein n=1 Tax=Rhizophlyctis rosea TaxID=64517 RepID=A0AAD5S7K0_9FUNG|nr:hypothetical protein HK097_010452 [Rhizophlyctis rosea]
MHTEYEIAEPPKNGADYSPLTIPYGPSVEMDYLKSKLAIVTDGDACMGAYSTCLKMTYESGLLTDADRFSGYIAEDQCELLENSCTSVGGWRCDCSPGRRWRTWMGCDFKWEREGRERWKRDVLKKVAEKCAECGGGVEDGVGWWEQETLGNGKKKEDMDWNELKSKEKEDQERKRLGVIPKTVDDIWLGQLITDTELEMMENVLKLEREAEPPHTHWEEDEDHLGPYPLRLCPMCALINNTRVTQNIVQPVAAQLFADLRCLVFGAESGVTFYSALTLLKGGAEVTLSSEVPYLTARRLWGLQDRQEWWERLRVVGLDMRDSVGVNECLTWGIDDDEGFGRADIVVVPCGDGLTSTERVKCLEVEKVVRGKDRTSSAEVETERVVQKTFVRDGSWEGLCTSIYLTPSLILTKLSSHMKSNPRTGKLAVPTVIAILPSVQSHQYSLPLPPHPDPAREAATAAIQAFLNSSQSAAGSENSAPLIKTVDGGWYERSEVIGGNPVVVPEGETWQERFDREWIEKRSRRREEMVVPVLEERDAAAKVLEELLKVL